MEIDGGVTNHGEARRSTTVLGTLTICGLCFEVAIDLSMG